MNWFKRTVTAAKIPTYDSIFTNFLEGKVPFKKASFRTYSGNDPTQPEKTNPELKKLFDDFRFSLQIQFLLKEIQEEKNFKRKQLLVEKVNEIKSLLGKEDLDIPSEQDIQQKLNAIIEYSHSMERAILGRKQVNVLKKSEIYEKYIAPALLGKLNPPLHLKKSTFDSYYYNNEELRNLCDKFSSSLPNEESEETPPDEELLNKIVGIIDEIRIGAEYENRVHIDKSKPKSYHEFIIRDILYILGIPFQSEIPITVDLGKIPSESDPTKYHWYTEKAVADLIINNKIVELFGDIDKSDYAPRKRTKLTAWSDFWFIDFSKLDVRKILRSNRVLAQYSSFLDKDACYRGGEQMSIASSNKLIRNSQVKEKTEDVAYPAETQCGLGLLGNSGHTSELEARIPLLSAQGVVLTESYIIALNRFSKEDIAKIRARATWLNAQPGSMKLNPQQPPEHLPSNIKPNRTQTDVEPQVVTDSNKNTKLSQSQPQMVTDSFHMPNIQEITQSLSSEYSSVANWSDGDKVAVYFKTPEKINEVLNKMKFMGFPRVADPNLETNASGKNWFRQVKISSNDMLNKKLKDIIRSNPFFHKLFKQFKVPMELLETNLNFIEADLGEKYAKSKDENIYINRKLLNDSFFTDGIHFVVHELGHWLTRQKEKDCYFSDPEESKNFSLGMAWEMLRGKSEKDIFKVFFPIIRGHFDNDEKAKALFKLLYANAIKEKEELG